MFSFFVFCCFFFFGGGYYYFFYIGHCKTCDPGTGLFLARELYLSKTGKLPAGKKYWPLFQNIPYLRVWMGGGSGNQYSLKNLAHYSSH